MAVRYTLCAARAILCAPTVYFTLPWLYTVQCTALPRPAFQWGPNPPLAGEGNPYWFCRNQFPGSGFDKLTPRGEENL
jgi:hypothetical protein